jgi:hypothetical protein
MSNENSEVSNEDRDRLLGEAAGFLVTLGFAMVQHGRKERNGQAVAAGIAVQTAGDVSSSLRRSIQYREFYSAALLGRQILEVCQLIKYFGTAPERAEFWLTASDEEMKKAPDFRPKALRESTRSSHRMYNTHCCLGGHPRSMARLLLPGSPWRRHGSVIDLTEAGFDVRTDVKSLLLTDALQHVYETVLTTIEIMDIDVIESFGSSEDSITNRISELVRGLTYWRDHDPLARVGSIGV